jgi:lysozyme
MADATAKPQQRSLAPLVGAGAAALLFVLTPSFEGERLTTYRDLGGVLTYCDGATENAQWGKTYTPAECRAQLERDLARHAEGVMACLSVPVTEGQKAAFVDFAFNVGVTAFCHSSVARKTNAGDWRGGCDALLLWNKVGGREVAGLTRRRQREREFCLKGLT